MSANKIFADAKLLLKDKVAIITGAAHGIGRGIALEMAREGAKIVVADINIEEAQKTANMLKDISSQYLIVPLDLREPKQIDQLVDKVLQHFGRIDILVNNAGINAKDGGILNTEKEHFMEVLNCNLIGPYLLTQRVVSQMVAQKIAGSVIFTSSVHGKIIMLRPAYSISKAGIEMLVKEIALELAPYGIRVNAVAPGAIDIHGEQNRNNRHVPLGYSGTPQDVANAMVFLASDKGSYITGQTITVDGAFSLAHTRYWMSKGIL